MNLGLNEAFTAIGVKKGKGCQTIMATFRFENEQ